MNREDFIELHGDLCNRIKVTTAAKNADYTGAGDDPFANFNTVELIGICSAEQGILTRMTDKLTRISTFVKKGVLQVKDESIEDTLLDLANYSILLACYIIDKKEKVKKAGP